MLEASLGCTKTLLDQGEVPQDIHQLLLVVYHPGEPHGLGEKRQRFTSSTLMYQGFTQAGEGLSHFSLITEAPP